MPVVSINSFSATLDLLLAEEIDLSGQLLQLITQEKSSLEFLPEPEADYSVRFKLSLLQKLEDLSNKRQHLMLNAGFENTLEGVKECIAAYPHVAALDKKFSQLADLARKCHSANQMLGQMLNRKTGFFSRLLSQLASAGQAPGLYSANGQKDAPSSLHRRLSI
jgi:flagellar biosynthesis/type III secretory pathway chaperone